jgi:hypothetical protein
MESFMLCVTATFEADRLKMLSDTEEGGKKEFERKKVTESIQGDCTSECREVVSHIVRLPRPPSQLIQFKMQAKRKAALCLE